MAANIINPLQATATNAVPAIQPNVVNAVLDPQTGLVQNQLGKILDANSPLMQRAAAKANEQSNARGMLNSSMAIGSAQNAVIANALPIAQADAAAQNDINRFNAANANDINKFNASSTTDISKFNAANATDISKFNTGQSNEVNKFNADIALQNQKVQQDTVVQVNKQVVDATDSYNRVRAGIATDPNMSTESKNVSIAELDKLYAEQMKALNSLSTLNLPGLLDFSGLAQLGKTRYDTYNNQNARKNFLASADSINDPGSSFYPAQGYQWDRTVGSWMKPAPGSGAYSPMGNFLARLRI